MSDLLQRWAECAHDQDVNDPHYSLCVNGCGAWVEYIPEDDDRYYVEVAFELRCYVIEEEPG